MGVDKTLSWVFAELFVGTPLNKNKGERYGNGRVWLKTKNNWGRT